MRKTPNPPASRRPQTRSRPKLKPVAVPEPPQPAPPTTAHQGRQVERTFAPVIQAEAPKIPVGRSPTPRPTPAAEVVRAAKPASVSITLPPPIVTARARIEGDPSATYAFSSKDPDRAYLMRHRIVPLSDVIPSQLDSLQPNPDYPSELQPRDRTRQASRHQILNIAKRLSPAMLIEDARSLKSGPPIVGDDMVVESGSGRVLAIRFAEEHLPDQYQAYKQAVTDIAPSLGIDSEQVAGMKTPVLVRERVTPVDRRAFAEEANSPDVMSASPVEDALREARLVPDSALTQLEALGNEDPDKNIDTIINSAAFARTIGAYMQSLPPNEQGALVTRDGSRLNTIGKQRFKAALLAKVYGDGGASRKLAETFLDDDVQMRNVESAIYNSLRSMGELKGKISQGQLPAELDITEDIAVAVNTLQMVKDRNIAVDQYLAQTTFMEDTALTETQLGLLLALEKFKRSPRKLREIFHNYAVRAAQERQPGQTMMIAQEDKSATDIIREVIRDREMGDVQPGMDMGGTPMVATQEDFSGGTKFRPTKARGNYTRRRGVF